MNTESHNVYKFTVSSQPNTHMRFSFTPVSTGEVVSNSPFLYFSPIVDELCQTIEIIVRPAADANITASTPLAPIPQPDPPQYSTAISSAPRAPTHLRASASSSEQRPSTSQAINRLFEAMPSQIRRDLATWSETEPETDDEVLKVSLLLYISMYRLNSNPRTRTHRERCRKTSRRDRLRSAGRLRRNRALLPVSSPFLGHRPVFLFVMSCSSSCLGRLHALVIVVLKLFVAMY